MTEVAVVILNWNGKAFLEKFLPSVVNYSRDYAKIYVADNASADDSVKFLSENYPEINIIISDTNRGFADGYNYALSKIEAKYFILLNSDIEVTSGWISPVIALMESDETIAACQPKLLSYDNKEKFEYAGAAGGYIDQLGYPFCRGRMFLSLEKDEGQYDDVKEIFWATGACMFVRADLFRKFEGFDSDFFAHMEEIDLCWRFKNADHKVMYCPDSKVYHVGGGTLPKISWRKTYLNFRNNIVLIYKNLPLHKLVIILMIRFVLDGIAGLKFLFEGDYKDCYAVMKAHFYFYKTFKRQREKRRKITYSSKVSQIYKKSIVFDYYILRKRKFSELEL